MENGVSGAITDMDTLLRHPATVGAARLTGNTNFLPAAACSGGVKIDGEPVAAKCYNVDPELLHAGCVLQSGKRRWARLV